MNEISEIVLGIDLGTTNSCVAVVKGKTPFVLINREGSRTTPSVALFEYDGSNWVWTIGETAKRQKEINPDVIYSVKRYIGKETSKTFRSGGKDWKAEEVSARVLRYLVDCAQEQLGGVNINRVIVTVPAYFDEVERQATKDAGKIAGLKVERVIDEPTAAALAYGLDKIGEQNILIYDLGGGTFDVSILSISKGKEKDDVGVFETIATSGDKNLGGDNFNERMVDYAVASFKKTTGIDLKTKDNSEDERRVTMQKLDEACEKAKHELSNKLETIIYSSYIANEVIGTKVKNYNLSVKISRSDFENMIKDYMETTSKEIDKAIEKASEKREGFTKENINQVVLVGGSTRMPIVEKLIKGKFGDRKINKSVNPDEVVAIGAAIQGAVLTGGIKDVLLLNVTPLSLGIEVEGGLTDKVIPANTTIPFTKKVTYSTSTDNQEAVLIRVLQGERTRSIDNRALGTFELRGIERAPRGVPQIEVSFSITSDNMIKVTALDKKSGKVADIQIEKNKFSLSDQEIERMKQEAEREKENDEKIKERIGILNEAKAYLHTFEAEIGKMEKDENSKNDPKFEKFKEIYNNLKKAVEEEDHESLKKQIGEINESLRIFNELKGKMSSKEKEKKEDVVTEPESSSSDTNKEQEVEPEEVKEN